MTRLAMATAVFMRSVAVDGRAWRYLDPRSRLTFAADGAILLPRGGTRTPAGLH